MPSFDESEGVFFDARDYLSSDESVLVKEESGCVDSRYEIWLREPKSVKERRESFLNRMKVIESQELSGLETMELERVIVLETSGAVSSSCGSSGVTIRDDLVCEREKSSDGANCLVDVCEPNWFNNTAIDAEKQCKFNNVCSCSPKNENLDKMKKKKKAMNWWKYFVRKNRDTNPELFSKEGTMIRMKVEPYKKRFMECSAVYAVQEISAHNGLIWSMKFSPNEQYLASGGEDGIVCIWRVSSVYPSSKTSNYNFATQDLEPELGNRRKKFSSTRIVIPERIFHIEEKPLKKFRDHAGDVLDVAWSTTNHILSSSMDKSVRLWHVDSVECLAVFHHNNYVTCVQFNPVDENYFISGSIDGKVRIWDVQERRVVYWADVRDIVTAVCYQPNGEGFIVGSISGNCRFYKYSVNGFLLNVEIDIRGRKKLPRNKITGIQFLKNESQRVMITSEDSTICILDGFEVVHKYRGLPKSKTQMSASFTHSGQHVISVGDDCRVYVWNYNGLCIHTSKQPKSIRSCEHFFFQGVSVALPWTSLKTSIYPNRPSPVDHQDERFSLASWFSGDRSTRSSITWPKEKLPLWDLQPWDDYNDWQWRKKIDGSSNLSMTWGLVILTGGRDGMIRTFHNYGLPVKM